MGGPEGSPPRHPRFPPPIFLPLGVFGFVWGKICPLSFGAGANESFLKPPIIFVFFYLQFSCFFFLLLVSCFLGEFWGSHGKSTTPEGFVAETKKPPRFVGFNVSPKSVMGKSEMGKKNRGPRENFGGFMGNIGIN